MKNWKHGTFTVLIAALAIVVMIALAFVACDNGNGGTTGTAPTVTTTSLANGTVGTAYSQTLTATGDTPITWSLDGGALPNGLTISTAGVISGSPETANTFNFTVKATNATGSNTKALAIVIALSGSNPSKTLTGITAAYTPTTAIFPDTTHDTLKEGLTVTAQYSDSTTAPVTTYTLSGDLTVGESVITVIYTEGGVTKTDTFTVTVNAPHDHIWSGWTTTTPATCTTAGVETNTCSASPSHYEEQEIAIVPTAHNYTWQQTTVPTCVAAGVETEICDYNNSHIGGTRAGAAALGHDEGAWHTTLAATCTATGTRELRCTRDNAVLETETIAIDPDAHDSGEWHTTLAATCTAAGTKELRCTRDNAVLETETIAIDPDAHDWNTTYTTMTAATVTDDGIEVITCKHNTSHTKDSRTQYATGTIGLSFTAINSNTAYRVYKGTVSSGVVHIPAYHRPDASSPYLPIMAIGSSPEYSGAFQNTSITSVTFAANSQLTTIGDYAFYDCTSLAGSINIPASVTSISDYAFGRNTGTGAALTSVTFAEGSQLQTIGINAFYNCTGLASITIPASVTSIGIGAFRFTSLASITIPTGVTSISRITFGSCSKLTSVTIPAGVTSIDQEAFGECTSLISIIIPASVMSIDDYAFFGCTSLTSVTFADTITSGSFSSTDSFPGDLRAKFYATDSTNGTPGTYTRPSGSSTWTRESS